MYGALSAQEVYKTYTKDKTVNYASLIEGEPQMKHENVLIMSTYPDIATSIAKTVVQGFRWSRKKLTRKNTTVNTDSRLRKEARATAFKAREQASVSKR